MSITRDKSGNGPRDVDPPLYSPESAESSMLNMINSNFGLHAGVNFLTGSTTAANLSATASVANRALLYPLMSPASFEVESLSLEVTANVTGQARIGVYSNCPCRNIPLKRMYLSGLLDTGTNGTRTVTLNNRELNFRKNLAYWLGVHTVATPTLRTVPVAAMVPMGSAAIGAPLASTLRRTINDVPNTTFPLDWNYVESDRATNTPAPAVFVRVRRILG